MRFFLGTHEVHWLRTVDVPLFISRRRLERYVTPPEAVGPWSLDSGGFTELSMHGRWTMDARTYADLIRKYEEQIGHMQWAAPQDWMCEKFMLAKTGRTVAQHQASTIDNYLDLRALSANVIPVLQGQTLHDYESHAEQYENRGVRLTDEAVVGLGSVCRREATAEIGELVATLSQKYRLHGFGVKGGGIRRYGQWLTSADSMAWSFAGMRRPSDGHKSCANHLHYALAWRDQVLSHSAPTSSQLSLALE